MHLVVSTIVLVLLLLAGVRVALALAGAGLIGLLMDDGMRVTMSVAANVPYSSVAKYGLIVVPLFICLGVLAQSTLIGERCYALIRRLAGRLPAGEGLATIGAMGAFAAVQGSSSASLAAVGPVANEEMAKSGYSVQLRTAIIAVSGTLGILIPPSIILAIYGIVSGENIGALLIAGIVPGLVTMVSYSAVTVWAYQRERSRPSEAVDHTADPDEGPSTGRTPELAKSSGVGYEMWGALQGACLFVVIMGGIYTGVFTPTEAAAAGVVLALIVLVFSRHVSNKRAALVESLTQTVSTSSMIFLLVAGASIYSYYLINSRVPHELTEAVADSGMSKYATLLLILVALVVMGCFLDGISILLISVPLIYPLLVDNFGFDGIWLGIVMVKAIELGLITPPVGLNVYVLSGVLKVPSETIFRGVTIFYVAEAATVAALVLFPDLVLWLPRLMAT